MASLYRYLDTNGDGTGTKNANGNYSTTPQKFFITPGVDEVYKLVRMMVFIKDSQWMDADKYGNNIDLSGGGITVQLHSSQGLELDLTDGIPIQTNGDWRRECYDASLAEWGSGNEIVAVRWTFLKAGRPLTLKYSRGDEFRITIDGNLTGLVQHYFKINGEAGHETGGMYYPKLH